MNPFYKLQPLSVLPLLALSSCIGGDATDSLVGGSSSAFEGTWTGTLNCTLTVDDSSGSSTDSGQSALTLKFDSNGSFVDTFGSSTQQTLRASGETLNFRLNTGLLASLTVNTRRVTDTELEFAFDTIGDQTSSSSSGSSSTHFESTTAFTLTRDTTSNSKATVTYSLQTESTASVSTGFGSSISQSTETLTCSGALTRSG